VIEGYVKQELVYWPCKYSAGNSAQTNMVLQEDALLKLVETYLASIPRPSDAAPRTIASLTPLPVEFPQGVITEDVK